MRLDQNNPHSTGGGFASWNSAVPTTATTERDLRRSWPDAVAFREAIQTPTVALEGNRLVLQHATVATDRLGMPLAYSGRFAVVFRLTTQAGERWALRCFTSPGEDGRGATRATRYQVIAAHTTKMDNTFVPFRYIHQGIRIGSDWFPTVAMRWATGEPLGRWVENHLTDPEALRRLCASLSGLLERLEAAGIAHGDWQHDNLLISEDGARVTLVDYDGMFVPEFAGQSCPELGHPNYQHPDRTTAHFGPGLDRFACLVIETALLALAHDSSLWARFADGESLLFKKQDLADPEISPVFAAVREVAVASADEELIESLARLKDACLAGAVSTLLPAVAAGPTPSSLFAHETLVSVAPPVESSVSVPRLPPLPPLGNQKWWQIPETAVALAGRRGAARAGRSASQASGQTVYEYLSRLESPETIREEQSHLWRWRGGALTMNVFLTAMIYQFFFHHGYNPFYFLWVLNFAGMGYARWPRKRIYDELVAEIAKMEHLVADRNGKIAVKGGDPLPATVTEYREARLRATPISRIVAVSGVLPSTLRALRRAGMDTMLDFQSRFRTAPTMSADPSLQNQIVALLKWCEELEMEATDEYRKQSASLRTVPVEVERLRHELAEFERHAAALKRERDQFPDTSFGRISAN